jgi:hypothetical protein
MSAPTRSFGKLSINTQMPTTRRQAQGRLSEKAVAAEDASSSEEEESSQDETVAPSTRSHPKSQTSVSKGKQRARSDSSSSSTDSAPSPIMSRAYKTRDILSTFHSNPRALSNNFRADIFEHIDHARTPAQCLIQLDLEGTIFRLAVNDHAVYKALRKVQPVQARALSFFDKVRQWIKITLSAFFQYAKDGMPSPDLPVKHPTVEDLGTRLQQFADIIRDGVRERHPHGADRAAECLIYLLRQVCNYNRDVFENNTWGRRAPRGENEEDRNLFQSLIGRPTPGRPPFGLEALRTIPESVLATPGLLEQLEDIRGLLHRHQAPVAYRHALQEIIDPIIGVSSPTAGPQPGQKRPAAGSGRPGQKRPK